MVFIRSEAGIDMQSEKVINDELISSPNQDIDSNFLNEYPKDRSKENSLLYFGAELSIIKLPNVDLRNSRLLNVRLRKANFMGANLINSQLSGSDLQEADLQSALLNNADLKECNLAQLQGANLQRANLAFANLQGANLSGCNLKYANLAECQLTGANFSGANLTGTILASDSLNHCRWFCGNQTFYNWRGMRFRSQVEIKIAQVLESKGLLYYPNSLARLGRYQKSLESDFLVCFPTINGYRWVIMEVDGYWHFPEKRAKEQERERLFEHCGVRVYRFDAQLCDRDPEAVVNELMELISK